MTDSKTSRQIECEVCSKIFKTHHGLKLHLTNQLHFINFVKLSLAQGHKELTRDKEGVVVSSTNTDNINETFTMLVKLGVESELRVSVTSKFSALITQCCLLYPSTYLRLTDSEGLCDPDSPTVVELSPGTVYDVRILCNIKDPINQCIPLIMKFQRLQNDSENATDFLILKNIYVTSSLERINSDMEPVAPYEPEPPLPELSDAQRIVKMTKHEAKAQRQREADKRKEARKKKCENDKIDHDPGSDNNDESAEESEAEEDNKCEELGFYPLPQELLKLYEDGMVESDDMSADSRILLKFIKFHLESELSQFTYYGYFATLVYLEEIQTHIDIRKYDMSDITLGRSTKDQGQYTYFLDVPGLMEGRPSLLIYDKVFVREHGTNEVEYEGCVNAIRARTVDLSLPKAFDQLYDEGKSSSDEKDDQGKTKPKKSADGKKEPPKRFDIRFSYNRGQLRLMHRALEQCKDLSLYDFVLPKVSLPSRPALDVSDLKFYNPQIQDNPQQVTAIKNILLGAHRPYPYILFGPPGTGKTATLVEAMKQIYHADLHTRLLVTAPSNSAADVLGERLLKDIGKKNVLRYYSPSCPLHKASSKLISASNYCPYSEAFVALTRTKLMQYRVIIATAANAARLGLLGFPDNHFTHLFIDESGQAMEPECIAPIMSLMRPWDPKNRGVGGHVILSGDPMQLGPVVRNNVAKAFGLDTAFLGRLMTVGPYKRQSNKRYNPVMITKLVRNFRSHVDILRIPNRIFYSNELEALGDPLLTETFCSWHKLPRPNFPLIFHGVCGRDLQELNSPSYFNPEEVTVVVEHVISLLKEQTSRGVLVTPHDIGIVTPYRKQVLKIRSLLEKHKISGVTVGSTEEFQGQERLIMIISTVRSRPELLNLDVRQGLGFLCNKKRFNVAVTRAQALLIIVGNPFTLQNETTWRKMLLFIKNRGGYIGVPFEPAREAADIIEDRVQQLELLEELVKYGTLTHNGRITISQRTLQEEPPWVQED